MQPIMNSHVWSAFLALSVLVLFVGGALYVLSGEDARKSDTTGAAQDETRATVALFFDGRSSEDAYQTFSERYLNQPVTEQHNAAHIFGEFLYRKDGIDGVVICDGNFGFGCYHSLFGLALAERGPDVAHELDARCFAKYGRLGTGCPHGIGHGLMWYFGDERLADALSFCDGMQYAGPIGGCTDGVFMEYNEHTMATAESDAGRRPYEASARHAPCNEVGQKYRQACYYQQAAWWYRSLEGDTQLVGSHCEEVEEPLERHACYRGLGSTLAIEAAYVPEIAVRSCRLLGRAGGQSRCLEGVAWMFLANPAYASRAEEVCAGEADPAACMEAAVIIQ